jgi:hypothetical protein
MRRFGLRLCMGAVEKRVDAMGFPLDYSIFMPKRANVMAFASTACVVMVAGVAFIFR